MLPYDSITNNNTDDHCMKHTYSLIILHNFSDYDI